MESVIALGGATSAVEDRGLKNRRLDKNLCHAKAIAQNTGLSLSYQAFSARAEQKVL